MVKIIAASLLLSSLAQAAPPGPTIQYIGSIAINTSSDGKALVDWYQKFGIPLKNLGSMYLGKFDSAAGPFSFGIHTNQAGVPAKSSRSVEAVFRVSDYDAYVSAAAKRGLMAETVVPPSSFGRFAIYRDPEGNQITVWGE